MMKRYSWTILLSIVCVFGIVFFYTLQTISSEKRLKYRIVTESGNPNEIVDLNIYGNGFSRAIYYNMNISSKMTDYSQSNMFNKLIIHDYGRANETLKRLQTDNKSFMRDKGDVENLYEDHLFILYGMDVFNHEKQIVDGLKIDVFDKVQNKSWDFIVELPENNIKYQISNIQNIELDNQNINIILSLEGQEKQKIVQIFVNLKKQKIVSSKELFSSSTQDYFTFIDNTSINNMVSSEKYLPFLISKEGQSQKDLYIIDVKNGKMLKNEKILGDAYNNDIYMRDNKIYYVSSTSGILYEYDLEINQDKQLTQNNLLKDFSNIWIEKKNNKLVVFTERGSNKRQHHLIVYDLKEFKETFQGKIQNGKEASTDFIADYISI